MKHILLAAASLFLAAAAPSPGLARMACPDLALVLAIDASGSVDRHEYALQMAGYAAALASPEVQQAIASAGKVSISVVLWGDTAMPVQRLPWRGIADAQDARDLGAELVALPRRTSGNTAIGRGLMEAILMIEPGLACAVRRVIDVSGDGRESMSYRERSALSVVVARDTAMAAGITINGLAITTDDRVLGDYYRSHVVAGPGAFVMEVARLQDFATTLRHKLVREIAPPALASLR